MITNLSYSTANCFPCELAGLSTDQKPTNVCNASIFYEMDTKKMFVFDAENHVWHEC